MAACSSSLTWNAGLSAPPTSCTPLGTTPPCSSSVCKCSGGAKALGGMLEVRSSGQGRLWVLDAAEGPCGGIPAARELHLSAGLRAVQKEVLVRGAMPPASGFGRRLKEPPAPVTLGCLRLRASQWVAAQHGFNGGQEPSPAAPPAQPASPCPSASYTRIKTCTESTPLFFACRRSVHSPHGTSRQCTCPLPDTCPAEPVCQIPRRCTRPPLFKSPALLTPAEPHPPGAGPLLR